MIIFCRHAPPPVFSLSSAKGGEGRGEEADYSNPLAPLGRGEGVGQYQDAPILAGTRRLCSRANGVSVRIGSHDLAGATQQRASPQSGI
jgi:hypothetical protein